jgi:hypothetical protein
MRLCLLLALLAGCGARPLELVLAVAPDCPVAVPAGGSLQYELSSGFTTGGAAGRVCGSCIPVTTAIDDAVNLLTFLRTHAPTCPVEHDARLRVRITSFAGPDCSAATAGTATNRLCGVSPTLVAGDGQSDQRTVATISCAAGCNDTTCVPTTCAEQGHNCDSIPNGCGDTIICGTCKPPEKCGGAGVAGVCGR